jgi:class 3 adenylate cyclase/tetratricopeptide (TPR) repeat protein
MQCPQCSTENPADSKFCRECGTRLSLACVNCGAMLREPSKFCPSCGAAQGDGAGHPQAEAPAGALQDGGPASVAERRLVSVLFADLVSFTTQSEQRDPEETRELLDRYFDVARKIIARYGGTVEKFIGDAVMALWGAPTAHEDDAERAVRAAFELVDSVGRLETAGGETLQLRAGVLTGEAAVTMGAEGQGMVAGDMVNTAARLQSVAPPGGVLVGDATRRATEEAIAYEPAGEQVLKGKQSPVPAFVATRVLARRRGEGRTETIEPPFVGRDAELRLVKDLFHATSDDPRPRLVSIMGQAGIGKSRLVWELQKYVDGLTEAAYWHQGRCPAYGDGVAYWALGEMVRRRAGIGEGEEADAGRWKLEEMLATFVPDADERAWIQPRLEELLGLGEMPAEVAHETVFAAWRTFFERVSEQGIVVMVFEDLHWADQGLLDFIEHVLDWSRGHPIYVLALARPELLDRRREWGLARRTATSIPLEPLGEAAMGELLNGLVPGLPAQTRRQILARAEGIPLYAVEMVRMLISDGRLEPSDGAFRPVGDLGQVALPESLQALIGARLDALPEADRRLLQSASVLGKTFTIEALAAITGADQGTLEPRLRDLVRREILVIDVDPGSPERGQFGFVQGLIREVAYSTLARDDRRRLHTAAARYFETLGEEELTGVMASHYLAAYAAHPEGPEANAIAAQARVSLRAAADRSARLASLVQAHGYVRQALDVTEQSEDRAALLSEAALFAIRAGMDASIAIAEAEEAIAIREQLGDRPAHMGAIARLGTVLLSAAGDPGRAVELLEPAVEEYSDLAGLPAYVELSAELSRAYMRIGRDDAAIEIADRTLPTAERLGLIREALELLVNRGSSRSNQGRPQEAATTLLGAIELARLHEQPVVEIRASVNLGLVAETDDPRVSHSRHALELVARFGLGQFRAYLFSNAVVEALLLGDWDWAEATAEDLATRVADDEEAARMRAMPVGIRILRGSAGEDEIAELSNIIPAADPQMVGGIAELQSMLALADGRFEDAYRFAMEAEEAFAAPDVLGYLFAGRAALWSRSVERAEIVRDRFAERAGGVIRLQQQQMEAGLAALSGRHAESLAGLRSVADAWRRLGLRFYQALALLDEVLLLGDDLPEARAAADGAHEVLSELRATRLLELLDRARTGAAAG